MVINVFNKVWFATLAFFVLFAAVIILCFRKKTQDQKKHAYEVITLSNLIIFALYAIWVMFHPVAYGTTLGSLPLYMCNYCLMLSFPAVKYNKEKLKAFVFYAGTISAAMAILMPSEGYYGTTIFNPITLGFWFTHTMLLVTPAIMVGLGVYKPCIKDILWATLFLIGFALFDHAINVIFRTTGICVDANYCFTYGIPGNPIMDILQSIIPIPFVFLIPCIPVLVILELLEYLITKLVFHKSLKISAV